MSERRVVIGTAGHIDHGKSTLVRALTGIDPDRLPEEQERGMTIDIGFAFWKYGIAFIDVPGHERFIKNMVAGVTGIDAALLVVAADDGVMPQTIEHYTILNLLGITRGVVAITKSDSKDADWIAMIEDDVRKLLASGSLKNAQIIIVDSISGTGLNELSEALIQLAATIPAHELDAPALLSIDRVFVKTGFGVVITGTVASGQIKVGDELQLLPQNIPVRIRGIQSQNEARESVVAGERAALNLAGIDRQEVLRGNRLCQPGVFSVTSAFDVLLEACTDHPIRHRSRVRMHIGTTEAIGRIDLLEAATLSIGESPRFARFQSEEPIIAAFRERFVIRRYSPMETVGGGIVLNPMPLTRLRHETNFERLSALLSDSGEDRLIAAISETEPKAATISRLAIALSKKPVAIEAMLRTQILSDKVLSKSSGTITKPYAQRISDEMIKTVRTFHSTNPDRVGIPQGSLLEPYPTKIGSSLSETIFQALLDQQILSIERGTVRLTSHQPRVNSKDQERISLFINALRAHGLTPPMPNLLATELKILEKELFRYADLLREQGEIVVLEGRYWILTDSFKVAEDQIRGLLMNQPTASLGEIATVLGVSRKYAVALLEELDKRGVTERIGDSRQLKSR